MVESGGDETSGKMGRDRLLQAPPKDQVRIAQPKSQKVWRWLHQDSIVISGVLL